MNNEGVKNISATPINAPVYPMAEVYFKNREYLNIIYETDRAALEAVVPEPLKVKSNQIKFEVINMPDSTGLGSYKEAGHVIPVEYNGEEGEFYLSMYVDNQAAIASGREVAAFPKKAGKPNLYTDNDTLVGTLDYNSLRVAQATMAYKYYKMSDKAALDEITMPQFMLKSVRDYDGSLIRCELTRSQITDIELVEAYRGPARLQLFEHVMAPLADFPVKKIVDANHIIAHLSLGQPRPVYDYLKS
ncbi:acetoacetate decarboxylase [Staphylococcus simulans]|uniref:acetoacetate decarboxylase n=1 Tax=Staphylococcus simulans TaxID=1286 RepID=UPI00399BCB41